MKITAISSRRKGLCAIKLEDGSELLLDSELVSLKGLSVGGVIDDADALSEQSQIKRAKSRALWYLSRADHSKKALYDKLLRGGFSEKACDFAIARMEELGLIDDEKYARRLTEYLSASGVSRRELYYKLCNKGISSTLAKEVTAEQDTDETEKIKLLIKSKFLNKLKTEEGVKKVFSALMRKGFSYGDVKDALKHYSEELSNSEDY